MNDDKNLQDIDLFDNAIRKLIDICQKHTDRMNNKHKFNETNDSKETCNMDNTKDNNPSCPSKQSCDNEKQISSINRAKYDQQNDTPSNFTQIDSKIPETIETLQQKQTELQTLLDDVIKDASKLKSKQKHQLESIYEDELDKSCSDQICKRDDDEELIEFQQIENELRISELNRQLNILQEKLRLKLYHQLIHQTSGRSSQSSKIIRVHDQFVNVENDSNERRGSTQTDESSPPSSSAYSDGIASSSTSPAFDMHTSNNEILPNDNNKIYKSLTNYNNTNACSTVSVISKDYHSKQLKNEKHILTQQQLEPHRLETFSESQKNGLHMKNSASALEDNVDGRNVKISNTENKSYNSTQFNNDYRTEPFPENKHGAQSTKNNNNQQHEQDLFTPFHNQYQIISPNNIGYKKSNSFIPIRPTKNNNNDNNPSQFPYRLNNKFDSIDNNTIDENHLQTSNNMTFNQSTKTFPRFQQQSIQTTYNNTSNNISCSPIYSFRNNPVSNDQLERIDEDEEEYHEIVSTDNSSKPWSSHIPIINNDQTYEKNISANIDFVRLNNVDLGNIVPSNENGSLTNMIVDVNNSSGDGQIMVNQKCNSNNDKDLTYEMNRSNNLTSSYMDPTQITTTTSSWNDSISHNNVSLSNGSTNNDNSAFTIKLANNKSNRPLTLYMPNLDENINLLDQIQLFGHDLDLLKDDLRLTFSSAAGYLYKNCYSNEKKWLKRYFYFNRESKYLLYFKNEDQLVKLSTKWPQNRQSIIKEKKSLINDSCSPGKINQMKRYIPFEDIRDVYVDHRLSSVVDHTDNSTDWSKGSKHKGTKTNYVFVLSTKKRKFTLAAPKAELMRAWIDILFSAARQTNDDEDNY